MDLTFDFPFKKFHKLLDQLVLINRDNAIHLVAEHAKVEDLNDSLASISAIGLGGEAIKQVPLLIDLQGFNLLGCAEEWR